MTVFEFNSKINLPKLFMGLNLTNYHFVKIPTFGWFAFTPNKEDIVHVFDLFTLEEATKLYRKITLEKQDYLDFKLRFSDVSENRLAADITRLSGWNSLWKIAKEQAETGNIIFNKKPVRLNKLITELGYPELIHSGRVGLINETVINRFKWLKIPEEAKNKILIPSFVTPNHICSLSYAPITDLTNIKPLWKEREHGWFGTLGTRLAHSFDNVASAGGFTWDPKADYWLDRAILDVSSEIKPDQLIKVWCEAKNTQFLESPLLILKKNHDKEEVKHHIKDLSYAQIKELEKTFGHEFISVWKNLREQQITIGKLTFIKKHNQYFMVKQGQTTQFTNFTMEINHIEKSDGVFYRVGHIYCKDAIVPFKIKADAFLSNKLFMKELTNVLFESGNSIPIVSTSHQGYLLDVINLFNEDATVKVGS